MFAFTMIAIAGITMIVAIAGDRSADLARRVRGGVTVVGRGREAALLDLIVQLAHRPVIGGGAIEPLPLDFGIVEYSPWR